MTSNLVLLSIPCSPRCQYLKTSVSSILERRFSLIDMYGRFSFTYCLLLRGLKLEVRSRMHGMEAPNRRQRGYCFIASAIAKLQQVTSEFTMLLCPSFCPSICYWQQICSDSTDIHEIYIVLLLKN